jgi:hypothetical protein
MIRISKISDIGVGFPVPARTAAMMVAGLGRGRKKKRGASVYRFGSEVMTGVIATNG